MKKIFSFIFVLFLGFVVLSNIASAQIKITNKTILCKNGKKTQVLGNDKKFVAMLENVCHEIFKEEYEGENEREDTIHIFFVNFKTHKYFRFDRDTKNIYQFNWKTDFVFDENEVIESIDNPEKIINLKEPSKRSIEYYKDKDSFYISLRDGQFECVKRAINASMLTAPFEGGDLVVDKAPIMAYNIYVDMEKKKQYDNKFVIYE